MQLGLGIVVDAPSLVTAVAAFPCMDEALCAMRKLLAACHLAAAAFYARHICPAHIDKSGPPRWQRWNSEVGVCRPVMVRRCSCRSSVSKPPKAVAAESSRVERAWAGQTWQLEPGTRTRWPQPGFRLSLLGCSTATIPADQKKFINDLFGFDRRIIYRKFHRSRQERIPATKACSNTEEDGAKKKKKQNKTERIERLSQLRSALRPTRVTASKSVSGAQGASKNRKSA